MKRYIKQGSCASGSFIWFDVNFTVKLEIITVIIRLITLRYDECKRQTQITVYIYII